VQYLSEIIAAGLGALGAVVVGVLTYLGALKKSDTSQAQTLFEQGVEMQRIASETAEKIRDELREDLARSENARRDAETARDEAMAAASELRRELEEERALRREDQHVRDQLILVLKKYVPVSELQEDSDAPSIEWEAYD
jgi:hypothetical protein